MLLTVINWIKRFTMTSGRKRRGEVILCISTCDHSLHCSLYMKLREVEEERDKELALKYRDRVGNIESVLP